MGQERPNCSVRAMSASHPIVLQNSFLGCVQIFPEALVRSLENYVGGQEQSDFQPAAFVSSLQGIVSPKIHFDGKLRIFPHPHF
jgi:hypothetical protein